MCKGNGTFASPPLSLANSEGTVIAEVSVMDQSVANRQLEVLGKVLLKLVNEENYTPNCVEF